LNMPFYDESQGVGAGTGANGMGHAGVGTESEYTEMSGMDLDMQPLDLEHLALPELMNEINPHLMADMNRSAPELMTALLEQDPLLFANSRSDSMGLSAGKMASFDSPGVLRSPAAANAPAELPPGFEQGVPTSSLHYPTATGDGAAAALSAQKSGATASKATLRAKQRRAPGSSATVAVRTPGTSGAAAEASVTSGTTGATAVASSSNKKRSKPQTAAAVPAHPTAGPNGDSGFPSGDGGVGGGGSEVEQPGEDGVLHGGAKRAERNRQSAAASRERKKFHIAELERRVSMLSAENAQLQVEQLQTLRSRIQKEKQLLEENKRLKKKIIIQDMKIEKLSKKLNDAGIDDDAEHLKRPSTWAGSDWGKKKS